MDPKREVSSMCHESWWRELRARRAEEARRVWQDLEESDERPREPVLADDEPAETTRLADEPVPAGTR